MNGLDRGHKHFTKCFGKFAATFIEIFHASFLLRYSKRYTKSCMNFSENFLDISISRSQTFWMNISTIITEEVSETFLKCFLYGLNRGHNHFTKSFDKFSEKHLLKYFTRAPWLQKIWQNVLGVISRNIRNLVRNFSNQYFYNFAQRFSVRLREMLR